MRIAIDLQGAQTTGSRDRGIGKYTLSFTRALLRNRGPHEVIIYLNGLFPESIDFIRNFFDGVIDQDDIRVWHAPGPVHYSNPQNLPNRSVAEYIREAALNSMGPDIVLATSLFEGLGDDAVTSIGLLDNVTPTAVILYDLIPLIYRQRYLQVPPVESWYEEKLDHLRRAELLFAISESSRQDAIHHINFPADSCVNVSAAVEEEFKTREITVAQERVIRDRYGLTRPFVMYTGGIDHRKNIEGLISAYAKLPLEIRREHQLAVVCSVRPEDRKRLQALAQEKRLAPEELVLTGFVTMDDLVALYNLCKLFVFPSLYEGFGLPALEAMSCGRPVIGSASSSVSEVIDRQDALFNPTDEQAIADSIERVLVDDAFLHELASYSLERAKQFSWDRSAKRALQALEAWHDKRLQTPRVSGLTRRRPKLAFISPLPPEQSGIADYSAELLPELSRFYEIEVVVSQDEISDPWIQSVPAIRDIHFFLSNRAKYDRVLYQFGNSTYHRHMFDLLEKIPGVVALHDFYLSNIIHNMQVTGFVHGYWHQELYHSHGYPALIDLQQVDDQEAIIDRYPCNLRVLNLAEGILVHSEYSRQLATEWYRPMSPDHIAVVPSVRKPVATIDRVGARQALGIDVDQFLVTSFGMVHERKLNRRLLEAWFASNLADDESSILVFVGGNTGSDYGKDLRRIVKQHRLEDRIRFTGWADADVFEKYLAASDLSVQLRTASRGETSRSVLDCLSYGVPTIVNANGPLTEMPTDVVWMLQDNFNDEELVEGLETIHSEPNRRQQLIERAREFGRNRHSPHIVADRYFQEIERFYCTTPQKRRSLAYALSEVVHEVGNRKLIADVSEAVVRTIPPAHSNRQILVDISELISGSRKFGGRPGYMEMLRKWLTETGGKERIEPISAMEGRGYHYARQWTLDLLDASTSMLKDDPIESQIGDIFIGFGLPTQMLPTRFFHYLEMRRRGIRAYFLIDELPLAEATSEADLDGSSGRHGGIEFLQYADCVIFGSRLIANRIKAQLVDGGAEGPVRPSIAWIHDEPTDFDTDDLVNLFESPKSLMELVRTQSVTG